MTRLDYIRRLVKIGYTKVEANYVIDTTAWSMVQLQDTVRCGFKLYDLEGNVRWQNLKIVNDVVEFKSPKVIKLQSFSMTIRISKQKGVSIEKT